MVLILLRKRRIRLEVIVGGSVPLLPCGCACKLDAQSSICICRAWCTAALPPTVSCLWQRACRSAPSECCSATTATSPGVDIFLNLEFCAPEVIALRLLRKPPRRPAAASSSCSDTADVCLDPSVDMWSLGAVLLYALSALDRRLPWSPRRGSENMGDQSYEASDTKTMCAGILAYAGLALSDNTG